MSTDTRFIDHVLETARLPGRLRYRKMFGEYALYLDDKVVALACDNSLFVKPTQAVPELAPELPLGAPFPGAKQHPIADQLLDDPELLRRLIERTAALLPAPKPKKKKAA